MVSFVFLYRGLILPTVVYFPGSRIGVGLGFGSDLHCMACCISQGYLAGLEVCFIVIHT